VQPAVRAVAIVPIHVERQLVFEGGQPVWDEDEPPRALRFDRANVALDDRQAPILPQRTKTMLNPSAAAPPSESLLSELSTLVGDEVSRRLSCFPESIAEKSPNRGGGRQRTVNRETHHPTGEVVDGHRQPPAEGPDLRQGEGQPGGPESQRRGNGREIHMPGVIRLPGGDDAEVCLSDLPRVGPTRAPKHPTNRRRLKVQTCAGEDLGDFHLSEGGAEGFRTVHKVADEPGNSIDRFGQLNERVGSFLIEPGHPGGDG
jgi:hypothetical protein